MLQMQRPRPNPGRDKSLTIFVVFGYCVGERVCFGGCLVVEVLSTKPICLGEFLVGEGFIV